MATICIIIKEQKRFAYVRMFIPKINETVQKL